MQKFTKRQLNILDFIKQQKDVGNKEILDFLQQESDVSRVTVVRDINTFLAGGLVKKEGKGRNVKYSIKAGSSLLAYFDVEEYFKIEPDRRIILNERFNFDVFKNLKNIFSQDEIIKMKKLNREYQKRVKKLSPAILKKELERIIIELSWKSSKLEGNTYTLIDTEVLIKEQKKASGHSNEEAIMILNHKKVLDYILDKKNFFEKISLKQIENIHSLIVQDLNIEKGLRKKIIRITGTRYKPLDNQHQIKEAMEKFIKVINGLGDPFSRAVLVMLMISYIQPFEDGNKRTSRLLGDAILLASNVCPLSFRSMDDGEYKKAVILFYEQNSALYFKELFIEQFEFAVENYFLA